MTDTNEREAADKKAQDSKNLAADTKETADNEAADKKTKENREKLEADNKQVAADNDL